MKFKTYYFSHQCDLPQDTDAGMVEIPPYLPRWKQWLRKLTRKLLLVDETHPKSKLFFRSFAMVIAEKRRHAQGPNSSVIHPFSAFAIFRERFLCLLYLLAFFTDPINTAFRYQPDFDLWFYLNISLDLIFLINIFISCNIGYCDTLTKEIVVDRKTIVKKYFKTFLIPDVAACLPYKLILYHWMEVNPRTSRLNMIRILKCLRLVRVGDFIRELVEICQTMNIRESVYTCSIIFTVIYYVIHWWACALYALPIYVHTIANLHPDSWLVSANIHPDSNPRFYEIYVAALDVATCHFYGASEGSFEISLFSERLIGSMVIITGYVYCNFVSAKILHLFGSMNISLTKYEEIMYQTAEYVRSKNLTDALKKRLILYYEYKFQKKYFNEQAILATLSEHLRHEVFLYGCRNILERMPLLQGMSKGLLGQVVGYMKKEIYMPNDVVLKFGQPLLRTYWVSFGTLAAYYGPDMIEILHFEDGDHFGDKSIYRGIHLAKLTVVALEVTEVFTLSRKDVRHCTAFVRELSERVMKVDKDKTPLYNKLSRVMRNQYEDNTNRLMMDLQRGRILEKDRWRKKNYK